MKYLQGISYMIQAPILNIPKFINQHFMCVIFLSTDQNSLWYGHIADLSFKYIRWYIDNEHWKREGTIIHSGAYVSGI